MKMVKVMSIKDKEKYNEVLMKYRSFKQDWTEKGEEKTNTNKSR